MRISGIGAARFQFPAYTPPAKNDPGELVTPGTTDTREVDVPVDFGARTSGDPLPPTPAGLDDLSPVSSARSSAGAGAHSGQRGQNGQERQPQGSTLVVVTDGAGNPHHIDMSKPGHHRIGGFVFETGGGAQPPPAPESLGSHLLGAAKRLLGF